MLPLEIVDRLLSKTAPEFGGLPPNRFRVRTGVGNRILFNQPQFLSIGQSIWGQLFARGLASGSSRVVEIGSGCGRIAMPIRRNPLFSGTYLGIDVDHEMVEWCQQHLGNEQFTFSFADMYNQLYNPGGSTEPYVVPRRDSSQDLVMSFSLYTHLLESDVAHYTREAARVLAPGGRMAMSVFCIEHVKTMPKFGVRWSFEHEMGRALVENRDHPEAAVAYSSDSLVEICTESGFTRAEVVRDHYQSLLIATL